MLARVRSASLRGVEGRRVDVEVHVSSGFPGFTMVGLPDAAVREARDRVRAALLSSGLSWPQQRVTVNLAPSGVPKGGPGLDLAIAVGLLVASEEVPADAISGTAFIAELGLDGSLRPVAGLVSMLGCVDRRQVVVAREAAREARLVVGASAKCVGSLAELIAILRGAASWPAPPLQTLRTASPSSAGDLADVRGQALGRRAVEVAAAGGHHLLLVGAPGCGKTMLAQRLPGLLPPLSRTDALAVAQIQSAAGLPVSDGGLPRRPPFRAPHHGATMVSLTGGGSWLRPGEISLAHGGVLFLDELGEFPAAVLDMLREPLEEGVVRLSRARGSAELPARFLLVAAMNPCPCGQGVTRGACRCTEASRSRYVRRLSGPLLDRFDLAVVLGRPEPSALFEPSAGEPSAVVARRVATARRVAAARGVAVNAAIPVGDLDRLVPLSVIATTMLDRRLRDGTLSARGLHRVRRVARTIADLAGSDAVGEQHVAEALALHGGRDVLRIGDRR